jgi:hypothetical protein
MPRRLATVFVLLCAGALADAAPAQTSDPFVGSWNLDADRSVYDPANTRPARGHLIVEMTGDAVRHTSETWRGNGAAQTPRRVTYTAKFDGREYPIADSDATVLLTRVNANTIERVAKAGSQALELATWSVSADRNTLVIRTEGVDGGGEAYSSIQYYSRQTASGENR